MDLNDFHAYRDNWTLWRTLGHFSESGSWVAPVSFIEAQTMPKPMLDVFLTLDDIIGRMQKQYAEKKAKENNGK